MMMKKSTGMLDLGAEKTEEGGKRGMSKV